MDSREGWMIKLRKDGVNTARYAIPLIIQSDFNNNCLIAVRQKTRSGRVADWFVFGADIGADIAKDGWGVLNPAFSPPPHCQHR